MNDLNLNDEVKARFKPFLDEILSSCKENIHSVHITGSALTEDFNPKISDINSILVFKKMDLKFLEVLAPLGKRYGKKRVAAPLIMTPEYVENSLDVFPIEFLNIKILHQTVFGEDIFKNLEIKISDLRSQCERELKVKLIGLRQGYISSLGNRKVLTEGFVNSFAGYIPLFRGIVVLLGREAPEKNEDVLSTLQETTGVDTSVFKTILKQKKEREKLSMDQLNSIFEDYYKAIDKLGDITDEISE